MILVSTLKRFFHPRREEGWCALARVFSSFSYWQEDGGKGCTSWLSMLGTWADSSHTGRAGLSQEMQQEVPFAWNSRRWDLVNGNLSCFIVWPELEKQENKLRPAQVHPKILGTAWLPIGAAHYLLKGWMLWGKGVTSSPIRVVTYFIILYPLSSRIYFP